MTFIVHGPGLQYNVTPESLLRTPGTPIIPPTQPSQKISDKEEHTGERYAEMHQRHMAQQAYQEPESSEQSPATTAEQIMSSPLYTLSEHHSAADALELMKAQAIRHLPVTDNSNKLVGIISERAILQFRVNHDIDVETTALFQLIDQEVLSATLDTEIRELAQVMSSRRIGALPIITLDNHPIGIVTRTDILQALVHHASLELWA